MRNILYLFVISFFLTSCLTDITLNSGQQNSKLVVNSLFVPNQTWKVQVSKSRNILNPDDKIEFINDATVSIYNHETGKSFPLQYDVNGLYKSMNKSPEHGKTYSVSVAADGFETVSAMGTVPKLVDLSQIDTSLVVIDGSPVLKIDLKFEDTESEGNYYIWEMEVTEQDVQYFAPVNSTDKETEEIVPDNTRQTRIFLNDKSFDGQVYQTSFYSYSGFSSIPGESLVNGKSIIRLQSVSKDLYEYYKTLEFYSHSNQNSNSNIAPPVAVHTNIENGLGIFGGYSESTLELLF